MTCCSRIAPQEPNDWNASLLDCSAVAPLDVPGRIALTTSLVKELGRPEDCSTWGVSESLASAVAAWLDARTAGDSWWRQAAEDDAAVELQRFEASYESSQEEI